MIRINLTVKSEVNKAFANSEKSCESPFYVQFAHICEKFNEWGLMFKPGPAPGMGRGGLSPPKCQSCPPNQN